MSAFRTARTVLFLSGCLLAIGSMLWGGESGQREVPIHTPGNVSGEKTAYPGVPMYRGKIVIILRGIVGLENARPSATPPPPTRVLVPRATGGRIPAHATFVRWRAGDLMENTTEKVEWSTVDVDTGLPYGYVTLDRGETLKIVGGSASDPLRYEHFANPSEPTSFQWITGFRKFCPRRNFSTQALELLRIDNGTLGAVPPMDTWSFSNANDKKGQTYSTAVAPGATWRLDPVGNFFWVKFSRGGALKFEVNANPIEIGNYPPDDVQMKKKHKPNPIDHHFELYDELFATKHGSADFHHPTYLGSVYKTRGGPSCGPGTLP